MRPIKIGNFEVSRVVEEAGPFFEPDFLFPDATPAAMEALRPSLEPRLLDPGTGLLVMSFHTFVIRGPHHTILVDTCIGNDKERPQRPGWHHKKGPFLSRLREAGVAPDAVDFVLCTHLHADHVGWNTRLEKGRWVPTFPNATYLFAERELNHWREAHEANPDDPPNHGSYADSVLPVMEAGRGRLVAEDENIAEGLRLAPAPGHTPGNVVLHLEGKGARGVMSGDVFHHPVQIAHPEWSSRFCSDPLQSAETRGNLLEEVADTPTWLFPAHFPTPTAGRVIRENGAYAFQFAD